MTKNEETKACRTASETYFEKHAKIMLALKELKKQLEFHKRHFRVDGSKNWGFVGDLERYQDNIQNILSTINS